jgi:response regulator RpfG family c-di-GMP phosphodiesterase
MDRVLIVDEDAGLRGLMCRWAESIGWASRGVAGAGEAVEELSRAAYDVAVATVGGPAPDGLWLAARAGERHLDTGLVLTAETGAVRLAVEALRLGVADYLVKPFERERFRDAIAGARDAHRAAAQVERLQRSIASELLVRRRQLADAFAALPLRDTASLRAVVAILTVRDRLTLEHSVRVASLASRLGPTLGLGADATADLERASLLHEVPRAAVPETVLWKTGQLTATEWDLLRTQPDFGLELCRSQPLLAGAAGIVRAMREQYDGSGYPAGLAGEEIPIGARILAVADAYDTMTYPQTHREPLPPGEVASEIAAGRGTQFDPRVADALVRLLGSHLAPSHSSTV